jgi:hypothetical protein
LAGVSPERAYAEIDEGVLRIRFGIFRHEFPLSEIESAAKKDWPYWRGIGWRANWLGTVGIIGTYVNVVQLQFKQRQFADALFVPVPCKDLWLSMENPRSFIAALSEFGVSTATRRRAASKRKSSRAKRATAKTPRVEEMTSNGSSEP